MKWMFHDPHLKVLFHEQESSKVFANTDIKGGVAITYTVGLEETISMTLRALNDIRFYCPLQMGREN